MLRLTRLSVEPALIRLKVEGAVTQRSAAVLEQELADALSAASRIQLDFQGVSYIGGSGVEVLRRLPPHRFEIVNCTPLIGQLLSKELA